MPLSEFDLIQRYFTPAAPSREDVIHGVGDDGAVLHVPIGMDLVVSVDTLVSGVHFFADVDPASLGHKALAVNLSDMAAMGAEPAWATLALTVPDVEETWLAGFSRGFFELAEHYGVQLVGGDTCRGPLTISVQMHGFVPQGAALRRTGAMPGDLIYVTGTLGDAGLALQALRQHQALPEPHAGYLLGRLERPSPRVFEGLALHGIASAAIDISDGLAADLGHILTASEGRFRHPALSMDGRVSRTQDALERPSGDTCAPGRMPKCGERRDAQEPPSMHGVGATLEIERLPVSPAFVAAAQDANCWQLPLSAGDDYELCFTVPAAKQTKVEQVFARFGCGATRIGVIESQPGLRCRLANGEILTPARSGYQHFNKLST